ncbi:MAG: class I SAM-dependent methyltransferase [Nanoarchaeota archaeon]|nr:class I SAM-dependent methyltransferase [Nanoarchaeota archaeon]
MKEKMNEYFSGEKLYGDDFSLAEIKKWYKDEKEGYSRLIEPETHHYGDNAINYVHGYSVLGDAKFKDVLGFGSARGDEFVPILDRIENLTIVDPSEKLKENVIKGKKINYVSPKVSGELPFDNNSFDLITCFAVLHHIPNVSKIIAEFARVLRHGGYLLIREPIVSMGDWRKHRRGITKHERGIPIGLFREMVSGAGLKVIQERLVLFPLLIRMNAFGHSGGNSRILVWLDYVLGLLFSWNDGYHARNFFEKVRPQSVFFVLRK